MQRRLEFLIAAMYGRAIPIRESRVAASTGWSRLVEGMLVRRREHAGPASSDGACIYLPPTLDVADDVGSAQARYRLLALEHAARIARGTSRMMPVGDTREQRLLRDLYLIAEGRAVDDALVRLAPGMRATLDDSRARSLAARPRIRMLTRSERAVESLLREALSSHLTSAAQDTSPAESLAWAHAKIAELRTKRGAWHDRYRGLPHVEHWGTLTPLMSRSMVATIRMASIRRRPQAERQADAQAKNVPPLMPNVGAPELMQQAVDRKAPPSGDVMLTEDAAPLLVDSESGTLESPDQSQPADSAQADQSNGSASGEARGADCRILHFTHRCFVATCCVPRVGLQSRRVPASRGDCGAVHRARVGRRLGGGTPRGAGRVRAPASTAIRAPSCAPNQAGATTGRRRARSCRVRRRVGGSTHGTIPRRSLVCECETRAAGDCHRRCSSM